MDDIERLDGDLNFLSSLRKKYVLQRYNRPLFY